MIKVPFRVLIGTFLVVQGFLLLITSGRARTIDEHSLHFMADSLLVRRSVAVPQLVAIRSFYGRLSSDGEPYAPYSPGQPMAASIYLKTLGPLFRAAAPAQRGEPVLLANEAATTLLNTTSIAILAALFLIAARALGASLAQASLSSALLVLTTPLLVYSKSGFSEPSLAVLAALLGCGLALWDRGREFGLWLAALAVSLAIAVKFAVGVLFFGAAGLGVLWRVEGRHPRSLIRFGLAPACVLLMHLAWNWTRFGNPLDLGYPLAAEMGRRLNDFDTPLLVGLFGLLISPGKGLFLFAPVVVLAMVGWRNLYPRAAALAVTAVAFFIGSLLLYGRYSAWEGGYCFGPRYLLPALPLLWLGLPTNLVGRFRRIAVALGIVGLLMQIPGIVTSFSEDQMAGGRYYDPSFHYRLDYTPLGQWALALRYLGGFVAGTAWTQPLGLGLDFWFVFLPRAGFARELIISWFLVSGACLLAGVVLLSRNRNASESDHQGAAS